MSFQPVTSVHRGLLNGRIRPPRQPEQTIPKNAPQVPDTPGPFPEQFRKFRSSRDYPPSDKNVPAAYPPFPRDIQRSNSDPNAGRDWRRGGGSDDSPPVPPLRTRLASMPPWESYNSEPFSGNPNAKFSSVGGNDLRFAPHPRRAETIAHLDSASRSDISEEAHQHYRTPVGISVENYRQQNGNAGSNLVGENNPPYGKPYPPLPMQGVDDRHDTSRRVSERTSGGECMRPPSTSGSVPNEYYNQNVGRYQEQSTNSSWNMQRTGKYSEPDGVSPRASMAGTTSTSPEMTNYNPRGMAAQSRDQNNISRSEYPHDPAYSPNYNRPMSGNINPNYQAMEMTAEYAVQSSEDTRGGYLHEDRHRGYNDYMSGGNDAMSIASRTTKHSIGSASTGSEYDDYTVTPPDFGLVSSKNDTMNEITQTGIDLQELLQQEKVFEDLQDDENPFRWEVAVWQDTSSDAQLRRRILLLDTQCEDSNWVSERVVNDLGATKQRLQRPAQFTTFNGEPMTTHWETTLSFRKEGHKATRRAKFLVAVSGDVPFDLVLGTTDIREYRLLDQRTILGLSHNPQNKRGKLELAAREAEHEKRVAKQLEKNRQMREEKRRADYERKNGDFSNANKTGNGSGNNSNETRRKS